MRTIGEKHKKGSQQRTDSLLNLARIVVPQEQKCLGLRFRFVLVLVEYTHPGYLSLKLRTKGARPERITFVFGSNGLRYSRPRVFKPFRIRSPYELWSSLFARQHCIQLDPILTMGEHVRKDNPSVFSRLPPFPYATDEDELKRVVLLANWGVIPTWRLKAEVFRFTMQKSLDQGPRMATIMAMQVAFQDENLTMMIPPEYASLARSCHGIARWAQPRIRDRWDDYMKLFQVYIDRRNAMGKPISVEEFEDLDFTRLPIIEEGTADEV